MKHNAAPEKNMNANAKGISDFDSGKTTNKGIYHYLIYNLKQEKAFQTSKS